MATLLRVAGPLLVVIALSSGPGCGGSDTFPGGSAGASGSTGTAGSGAAAACDDLAAATCQIYTCSAYYYALQANFGGDMATCQERTALSCTTRAGANGAPTDECIQALNALTCDDLINNGYPAACLVSTGTVADGAACGSSAECQSGNCAAKPGQCGACAPALEEGQPCTGNGCAAGLACAPVMGQLQCTKLPLNGEACPDGVCGIGLTCYAEVCEPPSQQEGDPCDADACDYPFFCDNTKTCQPLVFNAEGQPCGPDAASGGTLLCLGSRCVVPAGMTMGTCTAYVADGDACTSSAQCNPGALCDAKGACAPGGSPCH